MMYISVISVLKTLKNYCGFELANVDKLVVLIEHWSLGIEQILEVLFTGF